MPEPDGAPLENPVGLADIEAEHALQYKLLSEAERLLEAREGRAAREVVQQLYAYSEAHFGSEQVLMRLHSYPGYQAHEREHGDLLAALGNLLTSLATGDSAGEAGVLRRWLTAHIHHADQAFLGFMRSSGVPARL
ncbi:MAG: hemerythrin domain-containing protein [Acidobacteriota bacterium]